MVDYAEFIEKYKADSPPKDDYAQFIDKHKTQSAPKGGYDQFLDKHSTPAKRRERAFVVDITDIQQKAFGGGSARKKPSSEGDDFTPSIRERVTNLESKIDEKLIKHPNLYGAFGVANELSKISYLKYVHPDEREKFKKLSTDKQTNRLLWDNLELVGAMGAGRILKGLKPVAGGIVERFFPRTYEILTKQIAKTVPKNVPIKPPSPQEKSVKKITQALREAKPLRNKQETIYTQERSKRMGKAIEAAENTSGEARYNAMLGELKGEFPKVEYESLRGKVSQKDIDNAAEMIWNSPEVLSWEKVTAYRGFSKLFGEMGGNVPQKKELELLRKVYPDEFIRGLLSKKTLLQKATEGGLQLANVPRSVMSSFDLSAPFRQGLFLVNHPKRFFGSFTKMFKQFGSEKAYQAVQESIVQRPSYKLMKESGLQITKMGSQMTTREEAFMSQWAEKIPVVGRVIKASSRAHTGFLNKLRADVFDDLVKKADKLGLDPTNNMDLTKQISNFVNLASGRGGLGKLENAAVQLNAFFFSPRLMSSRLQLLHPGYYIKADPFVRKEALKSLFTLSGLVSTTLGMAKLGGAEVGTDWRSADFGKIKINNTRFDIMGGFQQYLRMAGQLATGEYVSSSTGKVTTLGEGYRPLNYYEIIQKQIESKEAPVFSFITKMLKQQGPDGKPVKVTKEIAERLTPMVLNDMYDIAKNDPELLPLSIVSMFGVGQQTYESRISSDDQIEEIGGF